MKLLVFLNKYADIIFPKICDYTLDFIKGIWDGLYNMRGLVYLILIITVFVISIN